MGKSSKQTTTSVNQRLPAGMEPANNAAYTAGLDAAQNFTPQVYDGQRVADLDPLQLAQRDLLGAPPIRLGLTQRKTSRRKFTTGNGWLILIRCN